MIMKLTKINSIFFFRRLFLVLWSQIEGETVTLSQNKYLNLIQLSVSSWQNFTSNSLSLYVFILLKLYFIGLNL